MPEANAIFAILGGLRRYIVIQRLLDGFNKKVEEKAQELGIHIEFWTWDKNKPHRYSTRASRQSLTRS